MKLSTMPDSSGPGRYSATSAMMSSNWSGLSFLISSFMPWLSSWNTAVVSPFLSRSKLGLSSSGIRSMLNGSSPSRSRRTLAAFTAQSMMVSVFRPRKSNFTSPAASTSSLSYWVTRLSPFSSQCRGAKSVSLPGAITTPPACLPTLRVRPSSLNAISMISLADSLSELPSSSRNSRSGSSCSSAAFRVMPGVPGIILESRSARP